MKRVQHNQGEGSSKRRPTDGLIKAEDDSGVINTGARLNAHPSTQVKSSPPNKECDLGGNGRSGFNTNPKVDIRLNKHGDQVVVGGVRLNKDSSLLSAEAADTDRLSVDAGSIVDSDNTFSDSLPPFVLTPGGRVKGVKTRPRIEASSSGSEKGSDSPQRKRQHVIIEDKHECKQGDHQSNSGDWSKQKQVDVYGDVIAYGNNKAESCGLVTEIGIDLYDYQKDKPVKRNSKSPYRSPTKKAEEDFFSGLCTPRGEQSRERRMDGSRLRRSRPVQKEHLDTPKVPLSPGQRERLSMLDDSPNDSSIGSKTPPSKTTHVERSKPTSGEANGERRQRRGGDWEFSTPRSVASDISQRRQRIFEKIESSGSSNSSTTTGVGELRRRSSDREVLEMRKARLQSRMEATSGSHKSAAVTTAGLRGSARVAIEALKGKLQIDGDGSERKVDDRSRWSERKGDMNDRSTAVSDRKMEEEMNAKNKMNDENKKVEVFVVEDERKEARRKLREVDRNTPSITERIGRYRKKTDDNGHQTERMKDDRLESKKEPKDVKRNDITSKRLSWFERRNDDKEHEKKDRKADEKMEKTIDKSNDKGDRRRNENESGAKIERREDGSASASSYKNIYARKYGGSAESKHSNIDSGISNGRMSDDKISPATISHQKVAIDDAPAGSFDGQLNSTRSDSASSGRKSLANITTAQHAHNDHADTIEGQESCVSVNKARLLFTQRSSSGSNTPDPVKSDNQTNSEEKDEESCVSVNAGKKLFTQLSEVHDDEQVQKPARRYSSQLSDIVLQKDDDNNAEPNSVTVAKQDLTTTTTTPEVPRPVDPDEESCMSVTAGKRLFTQLSMEQTHEGHAASNMDGHERRVVQIKKSPLHKLVSDTTTVVMRSRDEVSAGSSGVTVRRTRSSIESSLAARRDRYRRSATEHSTSSQDTPDQRDNSANGGNNSMSDDKVLESVKIEDIKSRFVEKKPLAVTRSEPKRPDFIDDDDDVCPDDYVFERTPARQTIDSARSLAERKRRIEARISQLDQSTPSPVGGEQRESPLSASGGLKAIRERYLRSLKEDSKAKPRTEEAKTRPKSEAAKKIATPRFRMKKTDPENMEVGDGEPYKGAIKDEPNAQSLTQAETKPTKYSQNVQKSHEEPERMQINEDTEKKIQAESRRMHDVDWMRRQGGDNTPVSSRSDVVPRRCLMAESGDSTSLSLAEEKVKHVDRNEAKLSSVTTHRIDTTSSSFTSNSEDTTDIRHLINTDSMAINTANSSSAHSETHKTEVSSSTITTTKAGENEVSSTRMRSQLQLDLKTSSHIEKSAPAAFHSMQSPVRVIHDICEEEKMDSEDRSPTMDSPPLTGIPRNRPGSVRERIQRLQSPQSPSAGNSSLGARRSASFKETSPASPRGLDRRRPSSLKERSSAARDEMDRRTRDENEAADDEGCSPGSIAERMSLLQERGHEDWKRRVGVPDERLQQLMGDVKLRDRKPANGGDRPLSLAERLSWLEGAQDGWKNRVEEKDVKQFTIEARLAKSGRTPGAVDSPLMNRKKKAPRMPLNRGSDSTMSDPPSGPPSAGVDPPSSWPPSEPGSAPTSAPGSPSYRAPRQGRGPPMPGPISLQPCAPQTPPPVGVTDASPVTSPAQSTPNIPSSLVGGDATHSSAGETDTESAASSRVAVPAPADEDFTTFFEAPTGKKSAEKVAVTLDDFDHVFMEAHDILSSAKKARPSRKQAGSRNPLRKLAARADIQTEYTETRSDVAEKEMKRIKKEQMVGQTVFAQEALAGLAAKVSFDKVTLKKTDALKAPGPAGNLLPYRDLMLIHIKGRRHCQLRLVEPRAASLNGGDCFLLVTRTHVFIWVGEYANVIEKAKASEVASYIQQKRDLGCQSATEPIVVNETTQDNPAGKKFWSALGEIGAYQDPGPVEEDELYEMYMAETNMAYRLTDDETLVPVEEFWGNVLKHELLSSKQAFVFDFGGEMYVWTGKHVPFAQRKLAIRLARELWDRGYDYTDCDINPVCPLKTCENGGLPLKCAERPAWCMFAKVNDNMETILFKEKFIDWPDSSRLIKVKDNDDDKKEEPVLELTAYDVDKMLPIDTSPVKLVLEGTNVGRGQSWSEIRDGLRRSYDVLTLGMDVWHVMEYDHYQVEAPSHGQFHEGDTYVIRWHYMVSLAGMKDLRGNAAARHSMTGREKCAYFFWQGRHSSVTEKGASALMTVELDEERGPQVRVVQGKEPPAFLSLFSGRMTTHVGKREDEATNTPGPWRLYVVRHELPNETCLNEVSVRVSSLRSRASFLLINTQKAQLLVWHGAKSTNRGQADAIAETIAERCPLEMGLKSGGCKLSVTVLEEGAENSTWRAAMEMACDPRRDQYLSLKGDKREFNDTPRLWQLSSVRGVFEAIEVMNPSRSPDTVCAFPVLQTDLYKQAQPALLLLDAGVLGVWLWQGWWPREEEGKENVKTGSATARFNTDRKCALETCINYCKAKPSASPPLLVFAGLEPVAFTSLFPEWVPDTDVAAIMAEDGRAPGDTADVRQLLHKLSRDRYSWQELLAVPLPEGVDAGRLESYLEDDEFEDVLGLTRDEFYALPAWRQGNIKKDAGLF